MKKFVKIICLILSLSILATSIVACKGGEQNNGGNSAQSGWQQNGVHTATVKDTSGYFIRNGQTDWTIVVPNDAMEYELKAVQYINDYTQRATGITYPVITDDNELKSNGKYISVGETKLLHNSGISIPYDEYLESGFRLLTKNGVCYIAGARSKLRRGTMYGAQEFLKYTIGFKAYSVDEVQYESKSTIKEKIFDVVEIPEFDERRYGGHNVNSEEYLHLLRQTLKWDDKINNGTAHSHFVILPPEKYFNDHPDWYWYKFEGNTVCDDWDDMFVYGQLCFSNEEMIEEFSKQVVTLFRENPDVTYIFLGTQDSQTICMCSNCNAKQRELGTNASGLYVIFTNAVARKVTEEIHKTEPDRELIFAMPAYLNVKDPPAKYDKATGEWKEDCPEVVPDANVYIQYDPLTANTTEALDHKVNEYWTHILEGWRYLCDINGSRMSVWNYGINFEWPNINHKNWDTITRQLKIYSENDFYLVFNEANPYNTGYAYAALRIYVEGQLMWDLSQNYNDLVEDFIKAYYGPAAEYVQRAYDEMTVYYEMLTENGLTGIHNINIGLNDDGKWSFAYVESQRLLFEQALEALEPLKETDNNAYQKYRKRVLGEYFENIFMQMDFYMSKYDKDYNNKMIDLYEDIADMYGITIYNYYAKRYVSDFIVKWRGSNV